MEVVNEQENKLFGYNTNFWKRHFISLAIYKALKHEINTKKFLACFISSALLGFLSIVVVMLFLYFINYLFDIKIFIENYGMIVAFVIGGYLLNLFSFVSINKNWDNLQNKD